MKNVCFFSCDYRLGGATVVALNVAGEMAKNYNVHLVAAFDVDGVSVPDGVRYHSFSLDQQRILKMQTKTAPLFSEFVKENDIDIVFAIGYFSAFFIAPFFRKKGKCKYVFCEHGAPANQLSDKKATLMRKALVRKYDMTVALTNRSERDFVKIIGAKQSKVVTIYNWIDERNVEDKENYDPSIKKLLTVGRISEEKGFDMLADIARDVLTRCPDWEWHIMGDGPMREDFEKRIKEYGIEDKIVMHGSVSEASRYFGDYSVMTLTSYREGLPLVLLEAKAKNLPCVSFDVVTGPSEIIRDGINGYLVPTYDKKLFADKLCALMKDEELRRSFSENAYLDIDKFKKTKILGEWIELTERLTNGK